MAHNETLIPILHPLPWRYPALQAGNKLLVMSTNLPYTQEEQGQWIAFHCYKYLQRLLISTILFHYVYSILKKLESSMRTMATQNELQAIYIEVSFD